METALDNFPPSLVWRGDALGVPDEPGVATGFAVLDDVLPGAGWPVGALTEILPSSQGIGELSLLRPALARLSREAARWIVWVAPPHLPYAPALQAAGVDLSRLVVLRPHSASEALWATRQALASGSCSAVLAWLNAPDHQSLRRLQLAAEGGGAAAFLFRPAYARRDFSPAPLRLFLEPAGSQLAVHVLKRRGPRLARPVLLDLPRGATVAEIRPDAVVRPLPAQPAAAGVPAWHG
jgi:cell division inhibitor SulA/protein ImuA